MILASSHVSRVGDSAIRPLVAKALAIMKGTERRDQVPGRRWGCWISPAARCLVLLLVAGLLLHDGSVASSADKTQDDEDPNPGKDVIVVLPDDVDADKVLTDLGIEPTHQYDKVINGFAATVSAADRDELKAIPGVIISADRRMEAFDKVKAQG